jgi:hypothetical protein
MGTVSPHSGYSEPSQRALWALVEGFVCTHIGYSHKGQSEHSQFASEYSQVVLWALTGGTLSTHTGPDDWPGRHATHGPSSTGRTCFRRFVRFLAFGFAAAPCAAAPTRNEGNVSQGNAASYLERMRSETYARWEPTQVEPPRSLHAAATT